MPALLVVALVVVPLVELLIILQVGSSLGAGWTIALLLAFSLAGAWLLKVEGRAAFSNFRTALAAGRWPGDEVAQGALVILGGALLLTPGFLTDVVGLLLLLRPTRSALSATIRRRIRPGVIGAAGPAGAARASGRRRGPRTERASTGFGVEVVEVTRDAPSDPLVTGPDGPVDGPAPDGQDTGPDGAPDGGRSGGDPSDPPRG